LPSYVHSTMDQVGFVKAFREQIRSVCDVVIPRGIGIQGSRNLIFFGNSV